MTYAYKMSKLVAKMAAKTVTKPQSQTASMY